MRRVRRSGRLPLAAATAGTMGVPPWRGGTVRGAKGVWPAILDAARQIVEGELWGRRGQNLGLAGASWGW
uniref:ATR3 n=1 Tax=Arundo donax TaxID=35708 RepID=A0A0A9HP72_ARUDO